MPAHFNPEFDPADVNTDYGSTGGDITVPTFTADYSPFKFWCQKTLPLVFDDSLSYYEVLCKLVVYVNNLLTDLQTATGSIGTFAQQFVVNQQFLNQMAAQLGTNTAQLEAYINARMADFSAAYSSLQEYVNTYFANLDVQEEINTKLDEMAEDGSLDALLQPLTADWLENMTEEIQENLSSQNNTLAIQNARLSVLEGRMDTFASLPAGSTSGNAELLDIRTNFLGETYGSAGDAVRMSDLIASGYTPLAITPYLESGDFYKGYFDVTPYKGGRIAIVANIAYSSVFYSAIASGLLSVSNDNTTTAGSHYLELDPTEEYYYGNFIEEFYEKRLVAYNNDGTIYDSGRDLIIFKIKENFNFTYMAISYETAVVDPITPVIKPDAIVYGSYFEKTPVDPTLTQAGEAADAKATGDAIGEVNERLDDIIDTNILYSEDSVVVSGSGTYVHETIYELTPTSGKTYSIQYDTVTGETTTSTVGYIRAYTGDTQTAYVNLRKENKIASYTVPVGITKLIFELYPSQNGATTATYTGVLIFEGVVPSLSIKQNVLPGFVITPDQTTFFRLGKNLVNPETTVSGEYINQTNGTVGTNADYTRTDYVRVKPDTKYVIKTSRVGYNQTYRLAFYTNDKQFISGSTLQNATYYIITTPANCYYIRCSTSNFYFPIMIAESETDIAYEEYGADYIYPRYIIGEDISSIFLNIPGKIYAVTGIETNIYFENITENWENYSWNVDCTKGMQLERGYCITPTNADAGTYSLTISAALKNDLSKKASKTVSLIIKGSSANSGVSKKVLVLGDSTTANGTVIEKLNDNFTNDVMTIQTIGTLGTSPNNMEGRSGWTAEDYCTKASSGNITNPFYNPTSETFDAQYYFTNTAVDVPDVFVINLGINDLFSANTETGLDSAIENAISYYDTMIGSIQDVSQNIVIGVCVTIPPNSSQDAFGKAYGCGQTRQIYKHNNTKWANRLIAEYGGRENENIYLIPINTNLDTKYNMGLETVPVNARNTSITYQSPIGNGGVHPSGTGYWQIADIYTAFLKALT